jgi:hypothetical protein
VILKCLEISLKKEKSSGEFLIHLDFTRLEGLIFAVAHRRYSPYTQKKILYKLKNV